MTTLTEGISNPALDLMYASFGLGLVTAEGEISFWKEFPGLICEGGFREQGEFDLAFANRNARRYQEAVRLVQKILAAAQAKAEFGELVKLGICYMHKHQVGIIDFGPAGWYVRGIIPLRGELRVV